MSLLVAVIIRAETDSRFQAYGYPGCGLEEG